MAPRILRTMDGSPRRPGSTKLGHPNRLATIQLALTEAEADLVVIGPSVNLRFATGYEALAVDRLTCMLVTRDNAVMILPDFDETEFAAATGLQKVALWSDKSGPSRSVADAFSRIGHLPSDPHVLLDDTLPFAFLSVLAPHLGRRKPRPAGPLFAELRMIKTESDLDKLALAGEVASRGVDEALQAAAPGMTELELHAAIEHSLRRAGAEKIEVVLVAAGEAAASLHHQAARRRLVHGEPVLFDLGPRVDGYFGDITQQIFLGSPTREYTKAYETVMDAQRSAIEAATVGNTAHDIDAAAQEVIKRAGYGEWAPSRTGHGIGMDIHEPPSLVQGNRTLLRHGMVVTIEPGIYIPGTWGIRIEDMVVVTESGPKPLTRGRRPLQAAR